MERQTFRAAHLVNNLLEFARPRPRTPLKTDLKAVLANAAESVETAFAGRTLTLEVDADGDAGARSSETRASSSRSSSTC